MHEDVQALLFPRSKAFKLSLFLLCFLQIQTIINATFHTYRRQNKI